MVYIITHIAESEAALALIIPREASERPVDIRNILALKNVQDKWKHIEGEIFKGREQCLVIIRPRSPLRQRPDIRRRRHRS